VLLGCLLVVVCTLALVAALGQGVLRERLTGLAEDSLTREINLLSAVAAEKWREDRSPAASEELAQGLSRDLPGIRVTLILPSGVVVGDSQVAPDKVGLMDNHAQRPEVAQALAEGRGSATHYSRTLGYHLLYLARRIDGPAGPRLVLRAALPLAEVEATLAQTRNRLAGALALGVLLSFLVAWLVAKSLTKPLNLLTRRAADLGAGRFPPALTRYPPSEMGELARAFDAMAGALRQRIEDLDLARARMEAVLHGMVEGVLVIGVGGEVLLANQALLKLLGISSPQGRPLTTTIRNPELLAALKDIRRGPGHLSRELTTTTTPPRQLMLEMVRLAGQETAVEVVAVLHDITERKRMEKMRKDFVDNVSHELRTPLTAIRASAETLHDGALAQPEQAARFVEMILRHTRRLEELSRDLLQLAQLESGLAAPQMEIVGSAEVVRRAAEALGEQAARLGVEIALDLPARPPELPAVRRLLEQAVVNLVDNAVKYCTHSAPGAPPCRVSLSVQSRPGEAVITVADNGPGIAPEHLDRIFERFYRVNRDRSRELGGTGLGLSIVKHVAQAHGGRVEVESRLGRGSTFRIILPAAAPAVPGQASPDPSAPAGQNHLAEPPAAL
jgi:two-component system phosphate regulon sensor histidine kinase PhoR